MKTYDLGLSRQKSAKAIFAFATVAGALLLAASGAVPTPDEQPLGAFAKWLEQFQQAAAAQQKSLADSIPEGLRLAQARQEVMQRLIREQPERALAHSLRWRDWAALPVQIQAAVEEPFSEIADFEVIPDCRPVNAGREPWHPYWLRMRGSNHPAFVSGRWLTMTTKERIPVQGIRLGSMVTLWDSPALPLRPEDLASVANRFPDGHGRSRCWLSGKPIGPEGRSGLMGGRVYHFASDAELGIVSEVIAVVEQGLGPRAVELAWAAATKGETFDVKLFQGTGQEANSQWTETPKRVLVLRLDFTPPRGTPYTYNQLMQTMAQASNAIRAMSYGKTWVIPTVTTQVLVLSHASDYYGSDASYVLADEALQRATAAGYVPSNYDHYIFSYPGPFGGWGNVSGPRIWLVGSAGLPEVETHELGHNYGLWHANYWRPQTGTGLLPHYTPSSGNIVGDQAIEHTEYGDPFDIMGFNIYRSQWADMHVNANSKAALNWIEPPEVTFASSNGVYRIYRFDHAAARANPGAKLALHVRNGEGDDFWASLRGGFSVYPQLTRSAVIAWTYDAGNVHRLLDTTPQSMPNQYWDNDRDDCMLPPGAAWTDPTGSFRIRNLGHGGTSPYDYLELEVTHLSTLPSYELYTTADGSVRGLTASFVNRSLSAYASQDDWRVSQTTSGRRVDAALSFPSNSWGARATVGLTHGTDADWEDYSVQWDGFLAVHRAVRLRLSSGDSSRLWVDRNHNGTFAPTGPEFLDNNWGYGHGSISVAGVTLTPGLYPIRIQYEAGANVNGYANYLALQAAPVEFEFFTTSNLTTPGITASFVNQSLRTVASQADWRTTQVIAGSRVQDYPGQRFRGWGSRAAVGLTGGTDESWGQFAAQWDGYLQVHVPTVLATVSCGGSRMWVDLDGDGRFGVSAPEFINNYWGNFAWDALFGGNSIVVPPGTYPFRIQYDNDLDSGFTPLLTYGRSASFSTWLAFDDCAPGDPAPAGHPDTTTYGILGGANAAHGPLKDVRNGNRLPVELTISHSDAGIAPTAALGVPAPGSPLAEAFHGYVDFTGSPNAGAELTHASAWVTYTFSGLNPAQRYRFNGAATGPLAGGTNRWTLCELTGAEQFTPAHSSARVLTRNQLPALTAAQAVLHTGGNFRPDAGDYVGWEKIQPAVDGSFAVTCRLYLGDLPGSSLAGRAADALTGLRLEEFDGPPALPQIVTAPTATVLLAGQPFTLSVVASGSPLFYQWYRNGVPIPLANGASWLVAGATTNDTGRYSVVVRNQFSSVTSAEVSVGVYPDAATAEFRVVPLTRSVGNGQFPLGVTGAAARGLVVIESSTNLTDWSPVFTKWSVDPTFDFTDQVGNKGSAGFYRAVVPPPEPPLPNDRPSVAITQPTNQSRFQESSTVTVHADATDPDGSVAQVIFFVNGNAQVEDTISPYEFGWQPTEGLYELRALVTDNLGGQGLSDPVAVTITGPPPPPPPPGTFVETNGLVVMEAEHFAWSTVSSGHAWTVATDRAGFVGEMAMRALPNTGANISANVASTSPVMTYRVQFATAGTHNFWIRGWAASGSDDSVHVGLNGQVLQSVNYSQTGVWVWRSAQVIIPNAGLHEINLWMREDGAYVDRLLLTTNLAFTPTGNGPPESPLTELNLRPSFEEWFPPNEDWPGSVPFPVAAGQPLTMRTEVTDSGSGVYTCVWVSDRGPIETQTKLFPGTGSITFESRITYTPTAADVGLRTITLTVEDPSGLNATLTFALNVVDSTNLPPGVTITYPTNYSSFPVGYPITVGARAEDRDGSVARLEFFANGATLGVNAAYQVTWQPAKGSYQLTAVATDNLGLAATSAPVSVTITSTPLAVTISAQIDGRDRLIVRPDSLQWEHLGLVRPGRWGEAGVIIVPGYPTWIDGEPWLPQWPSAEDYSSSSVDRSLPVPARVRLDPDGVTVLAASDRASVQILEQPSETNQFTLVLQFDDEQFDGADFAFVQLAGVAVTLTTDDLDITPNDRFVSRGPEGGPFAPATVTFTLANTGSNALSWSLVNTCSWLNVAPGSGMLTPGGPAASVTASLNAAANLLPEGTYYGLVWFRNLTSGFSQSRAFTFQPGRRDFLTERFNTSFDRNDLEYQSFTFTPDGSASGYAVCREVAYSFPTDPAGGTDLALGRYAFRQITLAGSHTVAIYGRRTNVFFVGSNGYLTLDSGDTDHTESFADHFRLPRISALFDELNPALGGTVSWLELSDRAVVTFDGVPEFIDDAEGYDPVWGNNFQIEVFYDGRIRLTYLGLYASDGLAGLSAGTGVPSTFWESDFTGYAVCQPLRAAITSASTNVVRAAAP